jgi:hypothetical protein
MSQPVRQPQTADVTDPRIFARPPVPGRQPVPRRRTAQPTQKTIQYTTPPDHDTDAPVRVVVRHQGRHRDWLVPIGIVAIVGVFGYMLVTGYILPAWNHLSSQWHYGDARINYQTMTIQGVPRGLVAIGYHGKLIVLLLANPQDKHSQAIEYIIPEYFPDGDSRAVTLIVTDVNHDGIPDIVVHVSETTQAQSVDPVLYGRPDGTFQWTLPITKG